MRKGLLAGIAALTALLAAACGGGDTSDLDAYCNLVREGVGFGTLNVAVQEAELQDLLAVAPGEVRDAVLELINTTRGLDDIDELDQLFDAAFDPDAQAAKASFDRFAVEACGVDASALPEGRVDSDAGLITDIGAYVDANFEGATWVPKVRYDVEREDSALRDITITFVVDARDDEAQQACAALSVYLYELRGADGSVVVVSDDLVTVQRSGPGAACEAV